MLTASIVIGWYAVLGAVAMTFSQYTKEPKQLTKDQE